MREFMSGSSILIHWSEDLDEMDKFLDIYNKPKLSQEDINQLNSPITYNKIEVVINSLSTKKIPGPDGSMAEF
jgi:hypothetical protein